MKTEYRIAVTLDQYFADGTHYHYHAAPPHIPGQLVPSHYTTFDLCDAENILGSVIEECAEYDASTKGQQCEIVQTNIRIESRQVTDWR